jgi:predicted nuclease of restriction endonuclease-like (RecB) superfamily
VGQWNDALLLCCVSGDSGRLPDESLIPVTLPGFAGCTWEPEDFRDAVAEICGQNQPSFLPNPASPVWSHVIELIRVEDPWKRAFYENECLKGNWSVRQLQRQIGSLLYERTGLSKDKAAVIRRARRQEPPADVTDLLRDPYILEFTGLGERPEYTESDLEGALLDHLQQFLLELGTGFCFEGRQKRITVGSEHATTSCSTRRLRHVLVGTETRPFTMTLADHFYLN